MIYSATQINGSGKPRLVRVCSSPMYTSNTSTLYSATSARQTSGYDFSLLSVGMRIRASRTDGTVDETTWAKITGISGDTLTVDAWTGGTPTDTKPFYVDGYVVDLPYCYSLNETFDPDVLVHEVGLRDQGPKAVTFDRGWKYRARLDYATYIGGDVIAALGPILALSGTDQLILLPRSDDSTWQHQVYFSGAVDLSRFGRTIGYKGPVFEFTRVENLASWPISTGYGYNYANDYGNGY